MFIYTISDIIYGTLLLALLISLGFIGILWIRGTIIYKFKN